MADPLPARPGRRLQDVGPNMSLQAEMIAVSEIFGIPVERLKNYALVVAAFPAPENGAGTEIAVSSPGSVQQAIKILELALADLRTVPG